MEINGKIVLVTGASSGIGEATAKAMAEEGAHAVLLARNETALLKVAESISSRGGKVSTYAVDISRADTVEKVARSIQDDVGLPDIIVNNAGAGQWKPTEQTLPGEAVEMMAVPYFGAFNITRAFLPEMLERRSGHIVNMTSASAYFPMPGSTAYTAARWAMRGFSESLRADLHGTGIHVTLIAPGKVDTPYFENNPGTERQIPKIATFTPLYPTLTAEQVAQAIVQAVRKNAKVVIIPFFLKITVLMARIWLRPVEWLLLATGPKRLQS